MKEKEVIETEEVSSLEALKMALFILLMSGTLLLLGAIVVQVTRISVGGIQPGEVKELATFFFWAIALFCGLVSVIILVYLSNSLADAFHEYQDCNEHTGIFANYMYAKGYMDTDLETFYAMFTSHPEMYRMGHSECRCIPTILYNSKWKTPVERNIVPIKEGLVEWSQLEPRDCVQIRLSYKDQKKLLNMLKGSMFDVDYQRPADSTAEEPVKKSQEDVIRATQEAMDALEKYGKMDRVVRKKKEHTGH